MKILCLCAVMVIAAPTLAQTPGQLPAAEQVAAPVASERQPDPAAAVESVKRALHGTRLPSNAIIVSLHGETVILSGNVARKADAAQAVSTAEAAAGGLNVSSQIEVRPGEEAAASERSGPVRDVEEALKQDSRTANLGILVSVDELQVVGLHGLVPSQESRGTAEAVAQRAAGNQRVRNYLKVPGEK